MRVGGGNEVDGGVQEEGADVVLRGKEAEGAEEGDQESLGCWWGN